MAQADIRQKSHGLGTDGDFLAVGGGDGLKRQFEAWETELNLSVARRWDALDWSIARFPSGGTPDVLSELSWSDLESHQLALFCRSRLKRHLYLRGYFNWAWIQSGSLRDSDYGQNDHQAEWSRSISHSDDDEMWDLSGGGGYAFFLFHDRLLVAPLVGWSGHGQNLRITDGRQVISGDNPFSSDAGDNPPAIGALAGQLNSTYEARWFGPWIGLDLIYLPPRKRARSLPMALNFSVELHDAAYEGEGNWNLRSDLSHPKSFEHDADAKGLRLAVEWRIALAPRWDLTLAADYQRWSTSSGTDRKFWATGGASTTRLNEVNWQSTGFRVGAACRF